MKLKYFGIVGIILASALAIASATRTIDVDVLKSSDHTKVWTPPAATDTLVGKASTDVLTHKTMDGATNVWTNIPLATAVTGTLPAAQMPALTGDVTTSAGAVATTIAANAVTNAKAAQIATATFKGRTSSGTGNVEDLTVTQATALLNALVGDSGSGGTKGLAPAPSSGDAAAGKFLKADGTWAAPAGGGGGGGSLLWVEDDESPLSVTENHVRVYQFQAAQATVQLFTVVRVPTSYSAGNPIKVKVPFYSNDTTGTVIMRTQTTLIRNGTDLVTSTTNQRTSTNGTVTMSGPKQNIPQDEVFDVTSSSGQVNSVSVSASDLLIIKMYRDASDTATSDVKVPVYGAEITFN